MSADSQYSGVALSFETRSKALTVIEIWQFEVKLKIFYEKMGSRSEKLDFNSILNLRRLTHFWLCLLETQVSPQLL